MKNDNNDKILTIENLGFHINEAEILRDISLEASRGEFIGLIGPNGAGKTTLLKCINGINKAEGRIVIGGTPLVDMNAREVAGKVAMLHQETSITFPFTVMDIVLTGRYHKLGRLKSESAGDYKIARSYLKFTDTLKFENRLINSLSGGERQRVLFAKALTQETDLVLLDEPSASLDIAHEELIFEYSGQLCQNGKTIIAAVHDLKTAVRFCTRLILMKDGEIIADGSPEDVVTKENLSTAYGVNALVYRNRISGLIDFHLQGNVNREHNMKVHVIGGGGSASGVIRQLFERGYSITAGVFAHGDSDLACIDVFGIQAIICRPFSEIDEDSLKENIKLIKAADITVLCDMPFGYQNIRNLEAAACAPRLVIIENGDPGSRDFTEGRALSMYEGLKDKAIVIESPRLHEVLP